MSEVVLTLRGLDVGRDDRMADFCRGYARSDGRSHVVVNYGATLRDSFNRGADVLDAEIRAALRVVDVATVMGHSRGAVVAGMWLAKFAGQPDAPPFNRLRFVLLGNPNRRLGGAGIGARTPDGTQYSVDDVTRRWDGHSNRDNWPSKPGAMFSGTRLWLGSMVDHGAYENVDLAAAQLRQKIGNTRYLVAP